MTQRDKQKESEEGECEGVEVEMNVHVTPSFDGLLRGGEGESDRKGSERPCGLPSKNSQRDGPPPPFTLSRCTFGCTLRPWLGPARHKAVHTAMHYLSFRCQSKKLPPASSPHSTRGSLHSSSLGSRGDPLFRQNTMLLHTSTQC